MLGCSSQDVCDTCSRDDSKILKKPTADDYHPKLIYGVIYQDPNDNERLFVRDKRDRGESLYDLPRTVESLNTSA